MAIVQINKITFTIAPSALQADALRCYLKFSLISRYAWGNRGCLNLMHLVLTVFGSQVFTFFDESQISTSKLKISRNEIIAADRYGNLR